MKLFAYGLLALNFSISTGCTIITVADTIASTAIGITVGTAKVAAKVTTTVIDAAISDSDEKN